jgi:hypothetical protein
MIKIFEFKGKWYRAIQRKGAATEVHLLKADTLQNLFNTIDASFNEANLVDLDRIQQCYQVVLNGEILRRDWL